MTRAHAWPIAVVVVLALTVAANVVLVLEASAPNGSVVEPDYYRRAVLWDSTLSQARTNQALGWRVDASLDAMPGGATRIRATLLDRRGVPIGDASVRIRATHNLDAGHPVPAVLGPEGAGRYGAVVPLGRGGMWDLGFEITRGADRFTADLRRDRAVRRSRS